MTPAQRTALAALAATMGEPTSREHVIDTMNVQWLRVTFSDRPGGFLISAEGDVEGFMEGDEFSKQFSGLEDDAHSPLPRDHDDFKHTDIAETWAILAAYVPTMRATIPHAHEMHPVGVDVGPDGATDVVLCVHLTEDKEGDKLTVRVPMAFATKLDPGTGPQTETDKAWWRLNNVIAAEWN